MKKYEDKRINFSYPNDLKLTRARQKYGQYDLEKKKKTLIAIHFVPDEALDSVERLIRDCPFDDFAKGEYYETVVFGEKQGIGHVVTLYSPSHEFIQKRYRYLFTISTGGLYIEIIDCEDFTVDIYKELLESITVKEKNQPSCKK